MTKTSTIGIINSEYQYPSLLKRIQALFIDFVLILLIFLFSSMIIGMIGGAATEIKVAIFVFCVCIYEPMLVAFTGGTIGHKMLGIQVKSYEDPDHNISIFSAIVRVFVKALLGWISFLTVTFNSDKRAIHDMASGSVVTLKPRRHK